MALAYCGNDVLSYGDLRDDVLGEDASSNDCAGSNIGKLGGFRYPVGALSEQSTEITKTVAVP